MENCWLYQGECLITPPTGYYGFIYKITDNLGRVYFGKKAFEHSKKKTISKKARKLSGTRKRVEKTKVDSGWLDYYGSSKAFLEYLDDLPNRRNMCKREIIKLCKTKTDLSYWEAYYLFTNNVLFLENCYNSNILGKFFKGKVNL